MKSLDGFPEKYRRDKLSKFPQAVGAFEKLKPLGQRWLSEGEDWPGLLLHGGLGIGKTSVAVQFAWMFYDAGRHAKFELTLNMVDNFKDAWRLGQNDERSTREIMAPYLKPDLLILDDVGIQFKTEAERNILYKIIVMRDNSMKPTILTTNFDMDTPVGQNDFLNCVGVQVSDRLKAYTVDADKWGGNLR